MRRSGRQDVTQLVGLAIAALVTFQGPIQHFLLVGRQLDEQEVLALVPRLAILLTVLLSNHLMARQGRVAQRYHDAQAHNALSLSHALSHATSRETDRDVLRHRLPAVAGTDGVLRVVVLESGRRWRARTWLRPLSAAGPSRPRRHEAVPSARRGPSANAIVPSTTTSSPTRANPVRRPMRLRRRSTRTSMTTISPGRTDRR